MPRTNAQSKVYNEELERLATLAESLGWIVDDSEITQNGLRFRHGEGDAKFVVWASTYGGCHWRKCQYIGGYASNHKSFDSCEEALRSGYEPDRTLGLGQHGISVGDRIKWRCDLVPNPDPTGEKWIDVCVEGIALFAFGENGRFIKVKRNGELLPEVISFYELRK